MRLGKRERQALRFSQGVSDAVSARKVREPIRKGKAVNPWDNLLPRNKGRAAWGLRQGVQSRAVKVYI